MTNKLTEVMEKIIEEIVREFHKKCHESFGLGGFLTTDYGGEDVSPSWQIDDATAVNWLRTTLTTFKSSIEKEAEERGKVIGCNSLYEDGFKEGRTAALDEAIDALEGLKRASKSDVGKELDIVWNASLDAAIKILTNLKNK